MQFDVWYVIQYFISLISAHCSARLSRSVWARHNTVLTIFKRARYISHWKENGRHMVSWGCGYIIFFYCCRVPSITQCGLCLSYLHYNRIEQCSCFRWLLSIYISRLYSWLPIPFMENRWPTLLLKRLRLRCNCKAQTLASYRSYKDLPGVPERLCCKLIPHRDAPSEKSPIRVVSKKLAKK